MTDIYHDLEKQQFIITIGTHTAYLSYQNHGDVLDYQHTLVPHELGGQGIGSKLVKYALDYAQTHQKKIMASCSFVASFIDKHDTYKALLV